MSALPQACGALADAIADADQAASSIGKRGARPGVVREDWPDVGKYMNSVDTPEPGISGLVAVIRRQLALSQEALARQLGISYTTVNRWEKGHSKPSRLARAQLSAFCDKMIERGKLILPDTQHP